jgi:hypothetical protein
MGIIHMSDWHKAIITQVPHRPIVLRYVAMTIEAPQLEGSNSHFAWTRVALGWKEA